MLSMVDKVKRRADLTIKRTTIGLTLTESYELINLDVELDLFPMMERLVNKQSGNIEEE